MCRHNPFKQVNTSPPQTELIDEILTGTTTSTQSGPESNDNEEVTWYSPELKNWSLTTRYSLVSYPGKPGGSNKYFPCDLSIIKSAIQRH